MRVLVIEDDAETASYIAKGLGESGYAVDVATDGKDGLLLAIGEDYDVAVVDRMLPGLDGLSVVETLRRTGKHTPVLFLSAMGSVEDRVSGLRGGGDDYLVKPFAFSELLARVDALSRRRGGAAVETLLREGDLELDVLARTVKRGGTAIQRGQRMQRLMSGGKTGGSDRTRTGGLWRDRPRGNRRKLRRL